MMKKKDIRPSLLDRLTNADNFKEGSRYYSINELRHSVQTDLQYLLNTRVRFLSPDEECAETQDTIVNFGLPDITTQSLVSEQGRRQFASWMERSIRRFEPRFKDVTVNVGGQFEKEEGLAFRIDAVLFADPAPEDVAFDSTIDPISAMIALKEVRR
ncbi:MAG: type VI secretion system protein ImpF [Halieaceae bacterium]|jgi:type VI secretion system protein ImpF